MFMNITSNNEKSPTFATVDSILSLSFVLINSSSIRISPTLHEEIRCSIAFLFVLVLEEKLEEEPQFKEASGDDEQVHEKKRVMRDLGQPTQEEIEEHNVDHTPYRSWCSSCVRARAIGTPHRARRDPQEVAVFGFDYLSASELQLDEKVPEDEMRVLTRRATERH